MEQRATEEAAPHSASLAFKERCREGLAAELGPQSEQGSAAPAPRSEIR